MNKIKAVTCCTEYPVAVILERLKSGIWKTYGVQYKERKTSNSARLVLDCAATHPSNLECDE